MRRASTPPQLPGYEYVRPLGSGGFADVFLYRQRLPRRDVAVKVLLTDELGEGHRQRFVDEANVMAQLSTHPYIVTIYHADVSGDDRPYLVMEYCSGPSLSERYKREPFGVEDALRTGVRLASAVATAHAAGILHRDIKPANVLTNDFGWPALTDFGIASTIESDAVALTTTTARLRGAREGSSASTGGGSTVGLSVPWSPPELFEDDPRPDARSDIFSLAATIHTLLAGRTPFEVPGRANGTLDLIGRIERNAITPIERDGLPRSLTAVLRKAMAPRPEDRHASAVDFARALQRVELELGYAPTGVEVPNLEVAAQPVRGGDDPDETRLRPISSVQAQPAPAPAPSDPAVPEATVLRGAAAASREREDTRSRGGAPAPAPTPERQGAETPAGPAAPPAETPQEPAPPAEPVSRGRRGMIVALAAVAAFVVAAGIAAAVLVPGALGGGPEPEHTVSDPGDDGGTGGVEVGVVPDPEKGSAVRSQDGSTVTFTWKNPKPAKGDTYQWTREATQADPQRASTPKAVVTGVKPGESVCIQVVIVRSGRASANPLRECAS